MEGSSRGTREAHVGTAALGCPAAQAHWAAAAFRAGVVYCFPPGRLDALKVANEWTLTLLSHMPAEVTSFRGR